MNKIPYLLKKAAFVASVLLLIGGLTSCGSGVKMTPKVEKFPLMYEEKPTTILILPPINESTAANAKEYYSTTIQEPICLAGYYTYPYQLTRDILESEGITDAEALAGESLHKFHEYFGADAVLFTRIHKWDVAYQVVQSSLTVSVELLLKSTTTGRELWRYGGTVNVDLSGDNRNVSGGLGLAMLVLNTAVKTAVADYVPYAKQANFIALRSIPYGKYHSLHDQDQDIKVIGG